MSSRSVPPAAVAGRLERLLDRLANRRRVRHAVVGATDLDGAWEWSGATGEARPDGTPMRAGTPWFLASVTKLHIAAVTLRLHERGVLDLAAPIGTQLPGDLTRGLHVIGGVDATDRLTPVHLLGHLSGLPDYLEARPDGRDLIEEVLEDGDRSWTASDAVRRARDHLIPYFAPSEPNDPRARIRYSDTNFLLLTVIAEHVTGRRMTDLYDELILGPLDLRATWLPGAQPRQPAGEPATVWLGDRPLVDRPLAMRSFGDLYSTLDDVLRFGRALFSGRLFDDAGTAGMMGQRFRRFGFPRSAAAVRAPGWPIEYGLGMMRFAPSRLLATGMRIPPLLGHTGSTGSWLWYSPPLRLLLAGTVDQATAAAVPFRLVPRALAGLTAAP